MSIDEKIIIIIMKKYFLFNNEPITGGSYFARVFCGTLLIALFGIGLWTLAATAYKRSGTFKWNKEFRVISAVFVPIVGIGNLMSRFPRYEELPVNLFDIIIVVGTLFHLVLLFKNGNKKLEETN